MSALHALLGDPVHRPTVSALEPPQVASMCLLGRQPLAQRVLGRGPDVLHVPGTRIERITPEARQAWRERMAELAKSETAQLEAERRRAQAAEAGKLAAQSPNHVSRRTAAPGRARANRRDEVAR